MVLNSAALIYFSPTRTTRKVIEAIASGIQQEEALFELDHLDLTPPDSVVQTSIDSPERLAIVGAPVYGGRLPAEAVMRLRQLQGNGAPAVVVVVYGNRAYEDALLELRDLVLEAGFTPIAAGAFIGEHSYSTDETPIAAGRPDADDLRKAAEFGKQIRQAMKTARHLVRTAPLQVPGKTPYKEWPGLTGIVPVTRAGLCTGCTTCASVCPTAAITVADAGATDDAVCIKCCACVKSCPAGARVMDDPRIGQVAEMLSTNCRDRQQPETYLRQQPSPSTEGIQQASPSPRAH